eukprot:SAG31_NODE_1818_length_7201_cov_11.041819_3_plen_80_part_00
MVSTKGAASILPGYWLELGVANACTLLLSQSGRGPEEDAEAWKVYYSLSEGRELTAEKFNKYVAQTVCPNCSLTMRLRA